MVKICKGFLHFCSGKIFKDISYASKDLGKQLNFCLCKWRMTKSTQRQSNIRLASVTRMPLPCTLGADSITQELIMQGDSYQHSIVKNLWNKLLISVQEQDTAANITYLLQVRQQYLAVYSNPELASPRAFCSAKAPPTPPLTIPGRKPSSSASWD